MNMFTWKCRLCILSVITNDWRTPASTSSPAAAATVHHQRRRDATTRPMRCSASLNFLLHSFNESRLFFSTQRQLSPARHTLLSSIHAPRLPYFKDIFSSAAGLQSAELQYWVCLSGFSQTFSHRYSFSYSFSLILTKLGTHDLCAKYAHNCGTDLRNFDFKFFENF